MSRPRPRPRGFSLVELLTSLVLIAIVLTLAVPSMERALLLIRARSTMNEVASALFQTRMTAVREGRPVEMVLTSSPDRCVRGYVIRARSGAAFAPPVDLSDDLRGLCLRHGRSPRDSAVGFNSRGMLRGDNSSFWYTDPGIPDSIVISIAGRIRRTP